jgi:hypothetical protein
MPSPLLPPPTQTGLPSNDESKAISQLAKKESPSTCKIRLFLALMDSRDVTLSASSVHAKLFTLVGALEKKGFCVPVLHDRNA